MNNWWWGWQNRTDLGKCTHQCDKTQGNGRCAKSVCFGCKKIDSQQKEEGSKGEDRQGADVKKMLTMNTYIKNNSIKMTHTHTHAHTHTLCFTIHTTSQSARFFGQTGIFFKTALQLAQPFVTGLWWLFRKIRTCMRFLYTPTSTVLPTPHQTCFPAPLTGALTPPLEVLMVTCPSRELSHVKATTWYMPSPVSLATWSMLVRLPGPLWFVSWNWHPPQPQQACSPAL